MQLLHILAVEESHMGLVSSFPYMPCLTSLLLQKSAAPFAQSRKTRFSDAAEEAADCEATGGLQACEEDASNRAIAGHLRRYVPS